MKKNISDTGSDIREPDTHFEEVTKKKNRGSFSTSKLIVLVALILVAVIAYFYWSAGPTFFNKASSEEEQAQALQKETSDLVEKVSRHLVLPKDEVPQVAEISDAALAAKEQPFYADAQNGDKLLVYLTLRKAIIYSPARDLIVNVGPIYMEDGENSVSAPATSQ